MAQSAYVTSEEKKRASAAGCKGFITKPVQERDLRAILDEFGIKSRNESQ